MVDVIYTIGYSGFCIEEFINEIERHNISSIIDVRSNPYSQYHTNYNKGVLDATLKKKGLHYRNYAREFGAQQTNKAFYSPNGYLDFDKFVKSSEFLSGIDKLNAGMEKGFCFALMCAEKDPFNCHRTMMVAREFHKLGFSVAHLLPFGKEQSQGDIEARLLDYYFPYRNQIVLFDNENLTDSDMISKAYRKRNAEIGFVMEELAQ